MVAEAIYLITGVPGAGKTTVARALARRFELAAHIEGDAIQDLIVSGGRHPNEEPREEAERQLRLRERNVALLVESFFEAGIVPVIDDVVVYRGRLMRYLDAIRSRPIRLVVLAPPLEVALHRDAERAEKHVAHLWRHLDDVMRREIAGAGLWLDTADLSVDQTAEAIVSHDWPDAAL